MPDYDDLLNKLLPENEVGYKNEVREAVKIYEEKGVNFHDSNKAFEEFENNKEKYGRKCTNSDPKKINQLPEISEYEINTSGNEKKVKYQDISINKIIEKPFVNARVNVAETVGKDKSYYELEAQHPDFKLVHSTKHDQQDSVTLQLNGKIELKEIDNSNISVCTNGKEIGKISLNYTGGKSTFSSSNDPKVNFEFNTNSTSTHMFIIGDSHSGVRAIQDGQVISFEETQKLKLTQFDIPLDQCTIRGIQQDGFSYQSLSSNFNQGIDEKEIESVLKESIKEMHDESLKKNPKKRDDAKTTLIAGVMHDNKLTIANLGDSIAFVAVKDPEDDKFTFIQ